MADNIVFEYRNFEFSDLKRISFDEFNAGFRSTNRAIRISRCYIRGTSKSVVIIAAPINWALWAIEGMQSRFAFLIKNYFNEDDFRLYVDAFLRAGVSRSDIHPLFLYEIDCRPYFVGGDYENLLSYTGEWLGEFRFISHVVDVSAVDEIISKYEMAIKDFGEFAICPAPEGADKSAKYKAWSYRFKEFDPLCLFVSPRHPGIGMGMRDSDQKLSMCKRALQEAISGLEAGRPVPWAIHYTILVRPPIYLPYLGGGGDPKFDKWEHIDFELLSMRCRLIRLLAWPQLFWSIGHSWNGEKWTSTVQYGTPQERADFKEACSRFELPYDPLQELDVYMASMVERYKFFRDDLVAK